ncbi:MAG: V-type ATP synthase subunit E family protein [Elusimicrobiales bacterium]|nr:V-type ATP synthase subunit E family protein [Elusimicrobiales bacterium]
MMEIIGNAKGLAREIEEMARRESAGIISAAEEEAARILADAGAAAAEAKRELLASALAAAARRREVMLAAVPGEAGRLRADFREAVLDSIKSRALELAGAEAERAGKAAVLAGLAAQAVSRMEGENFVVVVAASDGGAAAGLAAGIERLAGRGPLKIKIEEDQGLGGGVVVRDGEGRQRWDNSFRARLERLWPELRGRLIRGAEGEEK